MRRAIAVSVLSTGLVIAGAAPAAASTRGEYVAQVDPICQSFVAPENAAFGTYKRNFKRMGHLAKSGTFKAFLRQTKRTARSLNGFAQVYSTVTDQIATVPPSDGDAATIGVWLNDRRQAAGAATSAATALVRLQIRKFFQRLSQFDAAEAAGIQTITGFGFQVCGVVPV